MYTVGQFARICSVSAKTLRHYDAIGLLRPAGVGPENQYRYYSRGQVASMRRILFLRDLGLGLEVIREVMRTGAIDDPERMRAILSERADLLQQEIADRRQLMDRLQSVLADLQQTGGVSQMSDPVVSIKDVPAMAVVGLRKRIPMAQIGPLFGEVMGKLRSRPAGPPMTLYHDPEYDPNAVDVEVLVPVAGSGEQVLPAARVACATHVGPYDNFGKTYEALFAWVTEKGYQCTGPCREIYLVGPESGRSPAEYVTEAQIPIG